MFPEIEQIHIIVGYGWLVAALLLLILEAGAPGLFFFISLAFGCICTAPFAFLHFSFFIQAIIWIISSCLSLFLLRLFVKKESLQNTKTNIDALIGQEAIVVHALESHKIGQVKVKGEQWPAITQQGVIFHPGSVVTIIGIQGNKLIVR